MSKSCCCRSWIRCLRWEKRDRTLFSSNSITSCRQLKPMTAACTNHKQEHCFGVQIDCVLTLLPPSFTNNSIMALLHQCYFFMENLKIVCQISCDALEQQKRGRRARAFNLVMVIRASGYASPQVYIRHNTCWPTTPRLLVTTLLCVAQTSGQSCKQCVQETEPSACMSGVVKYAVVRDMNLPAHRLSAQSLADCTRLSAWLCGQTSQTRPEQR